MSLCAGGLCVFDSTVEWSIMEIYFFFSVLYCSVVYYIHSFLPSVIPTIPYLIKI